MHYRCVEMDEVGKMLSLIYSVESIIPMFMTQVYASLWKATSSVPGIGETLWIGQYSAVHYITLQYSTVHYSTSTSNLISESKDLLTSSQPR